VLHGEVSSAAGDEEARRRLVGWLDGTLHGEDTFSEESVEGALVGTGLAWTKRERGWAVPATEKMPREIQIVPAGAVLTVEAMLSDWDEIGAAQTEALARFLLAAQASLRWARCDLDERSARVLARVEGAQVDADLGHALLGVAAGCRMLSRETAALHHPDAARAYLEFVTR
jgi:hypothetical protein